MKKSATLRRQHDEVESFGTALKRLLEACTLEPGFSLVGDPGHWHASQGREADVDARYAEVSRIAGRAARAFDASGVHVSWTPRGYPPGYSQPVNPAMAWSTLFSDDPICDAQTILGTVDLALGVLGSRAEEIEEHEQSFEGRVAHAAGFWSRVKPTGRTQSAGFVQGVAVTVVGGGLLALLLHFFT